MDQRGTPPSSMNEDVLAAMRDAGFPRLRRGRDS
jgi:hypothetical protein